ncbi:MAG: glycosyltransferase [Arenicella sp.]|nr:glycosyltransferase [Arenicella sp.]
MPLNPSLPVIIIPAYNEQAVIKNTLSRLGGGRSSGFQIVVVCNGCDDQTESIVREHFPLVYCETLGQSSKARAIRQAEMLDIGFPRLYLDADIVITEITAEGLLALASAKSEPTLLAPHSIANLDNCSWWVQRFYHSWYQSIFVKQHGFGAGCYLVNQAGRARFGDWPDLIADDGFIRTQFADQETHVVTSQSVHVAAPKSLWPLLKVKSRSKYGNLQLKRYLAENNVVNRQSTINSGIKFGPESTLSLIDILIYNTVNALAFGIAKWHHLTGSFVWHRDNSNR